MVGKRIGGAYSVRKADLAELRKFIETTYIDKIDDSVRKIVEREMPDLVHKLPPKHNANAAAVPQLIELRGRSEAKAKARSLLAIEEIAVKNLQSESCLWRSHLQYRCH